MTDIITDPERAVADLERAWAACPPRNYKNETKTPLCGSSYDQKTVGVNPYWDIVRHLPVEKSEWRHQVEIDGYPAFGRSYPIARKELTKTYAWSIPSPGDIEWIVSTLDQRDVVEIGAGTGYWAWQLSQSGVDVIAYDAEPFENHWCGGMEYHRVLHGGPEMAAEFPHRALMLCWPPYDNGMAHDALKTYQGDLLIYIGEPEGGCTAGDDFFQLREKEWGHIGDSPAHVTFSGIHCYVEAYRRKRVAS